MLLVPQFPFLENGTYVRGCKALEIHKALKILRVQCPAGARPAPGVDERGLATWRALQGQRWVALAGQGWCDGSQVAGALCGEALSGERLCQVFLLAAGGTEEVVKALK